MAKFSAYHAVFVPNDGKVSVFFPDLPGCLPWGDTLEEAFACAIEALELHLGGLAEDGDLIPAPSGRDQAWEKFVKSRVEDGKDVFDLMQVQLVPAPNVEEAPVRVNLSVRRHILNMIDRKAEATGMTRSGFISRATESFQVERPAR